MTRSRDQGDRLLHGSAIRFGGSHVSLRLATAAGVFFPSQCVRTEPLTPLSPPLRGPLELALQEPCRGPPRPSPTHPRERDELKERPRVPSIGRRPSPRNALSDARLEPLRASWLCCHDGPLSTLFEPSPRPCGRGSGWAPVRALPCQRSAPLEASASFVDFCNRIRHAGTPCEPSFLAREWELAPHCSPASSDAGCVGLTSASPQRRPASRDPSRAGSRRNAPLARKERITGRSAREKADHALLTMSRGPSSCSLRAPGSPVRLAAGPGLPGGSSSRPRPTSDASPRRATPLEGSGCFLSRRNQYASRRFLDCARPDHAPFTPPPVEALLGRAMHLMQSLRGALR